MYENSGVCFTYKSFNKIEKVLKDKAGEEEEAKQNILRKEMEECSKARQSVDQAAGVYAEKYLKNIQYSIFENERPNIDEAFANYLEGLKIGVAAMVEMAEDEKLMDPIANIVYLIDSRKTERDQHKYQEEGLAVD